MAHLRLLLVGSVDNIHKIYENCGDSSSETSAEQAFGADYIHEYEEGEDDFCNTPEFTKTNEKYYKDIIDGEFSYCFDIRNPEKYGDYGWINIPEEMEEEVNPARREKEERNKKRVIEHIKTLPDETVFWFADSHW